MKKFMSRKSLMRACALALTVALTTGCSSKTKSPDTAGTPDKGSSNETISLTLWGAADDQALYNKQVEAFKSANPDKNYDIQVKVVAEGAAREEVLKDVEKAADVFSVAHDQLGLLVESGAVYENTKYAEEIKNNHISSAVTAAAYNGKFYGYPTTSETYILTYDKSKYTEDEVKSLDTMLAKEQSKDTVKFGFEFDSAYFGSAFFFANGGELFKDGDVKNVTYNNEQGLEVANYIASLKSRGAVSMKGDISTSQFKDGKLAAFVAGPWKSAEYKEALGENYGVAELPSITLADGSHHLKSFAGIRMFCVNSFTKYPEEAMALAAFLSSEQSQLERFNERNHLPTIKTLAENEEINNDETIKAVLSQLNYSYTMPAVPQMSLYWSPMAAFVRDTFDGVITAGEMQDKLNSLVNDITAE